MPVQTSAGAALSYVPTWVEWSITTAAFATFTLLYLLFSRLFPIISIWEMTDAPPEHAAKTAPLRVAEAVAS